MHHKVSPLDARQASETIEQLIIINYAPRDLHNEPRISQNKTGRHQA